MKYIHFEITINGIHLFNTEATIEDYSQFIQDALVKNFKEQDGYRITRHTATIKETSTEKRIKN